MWKSLNISSHAVSAFGEKAYEVVRSELHYFEIAPKHDAENEPQKDRRIIKYIDIGYHLGLEVWLDQFLA